MRLLKYKDIDYKIFFNDMISNERIIRYDFSKFRGRFRYWMDENNLDIVTLCRELGYKRTDKIRRLLAEQKEGKDMLPSPEVLSDLTTRYEDLNIRWLLTGKE